MRRIGKLAERVAQTIAAGEVVQDPASVVKELVENSIDAQATVINIAIANGGRKIISVLDDGEGIHPDDITTCVVHHATSKLTTFEDLKHIKTFGFRGEALAVISAVAEFEITSAISKHSLGKRLVLHCGRTIETGQVAFPRGTRVIVRNIFANQPARAKYLRSELSEFRRITTCVQQYALAHPQLHFTLSHNGRQACNYSACSNLTERVHQVLGHKLGTTMFYFNNSQGLITLDGLCSMPSQTQSNRSRQFLFLNNRPIIDRNISHAVYHAYRTLLMKGQHPAFVLKLEMATDDVDVNVHPAKKEVRFSNPQLIHSTVAHLIYRAILAETRLRALGDQNESGLVQDNQSSTAVSTLLNLSPSDRAQAIPNLDRTSHPQHSSTANDMSDDSSQEAEAEAIKDTVQDSTSAKPATSEKAGFDAQQAAHHFQPLLDESLERSTEIIVFGQFQKTYIIGAVADELVLIDQHAAHERILFEHYRNQVYRSGMASEKLLIPLTFALNDLQSIILQEHLGQWNKLGFQIELFGKNTFIARKIPSLLKRENLERLIADVLDEQELFSQSGKLDESTNRILESTACHSAIRAGDSLSMAQMQGMADNLSQININLYCPHGRPVMVNIQAKELEKRFKRIV